MALPRSERDLAGLATENFIWALILEMGSHRVSVEAFLAAGVRALYGLKCSIAVDLEVGNQVGQREDLRPLLLGLLGHPSRGPVLGLRCASVVDPELVEHELLNSSVHLSELVLSSALLAENTRVAALLAQQLLAAGALERPLGYLLAELAADHS